MYHVAFHLLRDVDDYGFLTTTYQKSMPRTGDRSEDVAPADPAIESPTCGYLLYTTYLPLVFKRTVQVYYLVPGMIEREQQQ